MLLKDNFDESGFVVITGLLTKTEIDELTKQVDHVFTPWFHANHSDILTYKLVNMHSLTKSAYFDSSLERVAFFNAMSPKSLVNLLADMFGSDLYFHNTQLFFNPLNTNQLPYWHRDLQFSSTSDDVQQKEQHNMLSLHIRIPLEKETGVELIPQTHKRWDTQLENEVRFERIGRKNHETLPHSKLISLDVGDVLIFSSQMLHRGNYQLNKSRKALDICAGKYHPLTFDYFDQQVLPTDKEKTEINNAQWFTNAQLHSKN